MKFALISDSTDALIGMRLAGVEGVRVSTPEEAQAAFEKYRADEAPPLFFACLPM